MISYCRRLLSAALLALLTMTAAAAGQTSDTNVLPSRLKAGDTIVILDLGGSVTRGRIERVNDTVIDIHLMTQGAAPNAFQVASAVTSIAVDQIAELHRVEDVVGRPEIMYRRRDSFGALHERLNEGAVVRVVEQSGQATVGRVTEVSPGALALIVRTENPRDGSGQPRYEWNGVRTFAPSLVERIEKPATIWDGAVKGAIVAAVITFVATRSICGDCPGLAAGYVMTGGIGAGIGLGIDALFGPTRVYRASRR